MAYVFTILLIINSLAFLFYGYNCLFSGVMIDEFTRFRLTTSQRKITGALQIIGALGLLVGFIYPIIGFVASTGLTLLMLLGFGVRLKIKDSFLQAAPSFVFMVLNGFLVYSFGRQLVFW